jgi:hypothetical protein
VKLEWDVCVAVKLKRITKAHHFVKKALRGGGCDRIILK